MKAEEGPAVMAEEPRVRIAGGLEDCDGGSLGVVGGGSLPGEDCERRDATTIDKVSVGSTLDAGGSVPGVEDDWVGGSLVPGG